MSVPGDVIASMPPRFTQLLLLTIVLDNNHGLHQTARHETDDAMNAPSDYQRR
jgi:hypothetical protein